MKFVVIGSGSIGSLFSSILFNAGQDVTVVEKNKAIVDAIQKNGLKIKRGDKEQVLPLKITDKIEEADIPDIIIFAVKSYDNVTAAEDCKKLMGPNTVLLTMQNGVGNYETISSILGEDNVFVGTTTFGSTTISPGNVISSETGSISIGEYKGGITPRINKLAEALRNGGFEIHEVDDVNSLVWTKLIVNVGINPIGALTKLRNLGTHENEAASYVQDKLIAEAVAVAKAKGIKFACPDPFEHVYEVCRSTSMNKASMFQDIDRGNKTEIRAINGAIVDEGKKLGVPTPVNDIVVHLVIARESGEK